jgi:hypothetical protein
MADSEAIPPTSLSRPSRQARERLFAGALQGKKLTHFNMLNP